MLTLVELTAPVNCVLTVPPKVVSYITRFGVYLSCTRYFGHSDIAHMTGMIREYLMWILDSYLRRVINTKYSCSYGSHKKAFILWVKTLKILTP
jgi:hypothetical protein